MTDKQILMFLGAGALAFLYLKNQAGEAVAAVGNAVNPVNPENVFNQGVLSVGQALTGDKSWTLGGWIYEITHDSESL